MSGVPFRGVSAGQDTRFTDKEKKLMKSMKFPKEYSLKVDVTKVNWEIMKEWTAQRVSQLLGFEDEVLIGYIHEQIGADKKELWTLLASACEQTSGIPKKILDDKAEELRIKNEAQKAIQERLNQERAKKEAAAKEAAAARSKAAETSAPDRGDGRKDRQAQNGAAPRDTRDRDRARDGRGDRDMDRERRDRPGSRPDRGPDRDSDRGREYDRRRAPSPVRPIRSMRDERDRGYDRDRGYNRSPARQDRGRDRGGLGRDRSPVLKKARYGRSRSPGRRSSASPTRDGATRPRSSRSRERAGGESKRELKDLHSTFAKAEAETVLPDKAEHLILPPQRVDTAFPHPTSDRDRGDAEADADMADVDATVEDSSRNIKKEKKEKKDKKEKKEKKMHKKEKKDKRHSNDRGMEHGSSEDDKQAGKSANDRKRIEEDLRQKALQSARKAESSDE